MLASEEYLAAQAKAVETAANTPKKLQIGQTEDQVVAILGQPKTILDMGAKKTYVYPNMKVIFQDGKAADFQ